MCNCPNSTWVQNANNFLKRNQNNQDGQWYTVDFLLKGHCGINNRTSIEDVLNYLRLKGIHMGREEFQQTILGELKRQGIIATLIYPGQQGGVFIPCDESEVRTVAEQVLNRIDSEVGNLEGVIRHTVFGNLFSLLRYIIAWIRSNM